MTVLSNQYVSRLLDMQSMMLSRSRSVLTFHVRAQTRSWSSRSQIRGVGVQTTEDDSRPASGTSAHETASNMRKPGVDRECS